MHLSSRECRHACVFAHNCECMSACTLVRVLLHGCMHACQSAVMRMTSSTLFGCCRHARLRTGRTQTYVRLLLHVHVQTHTHIHIDMRIHSLTAKIRIHGLLDSIATKNAAKFRAERQACVSMCSGITCAHTQARRDPKSAGIRHGAAQEQGHADVCALMHQSIPRNKIAMAPGLLLWSLS